MGLTMIAGPDDTVHEGIQNNPVEGAELPAVDVRVDDELVRDYVNAMGDEGYWAFSARVRAKFGAEVAPVTLFDRDIGAKLVGISARFALHAKQSFSFRGLVTPGATYRLTGHVASVTQKRGIDYFAMETSCAPVDQPGEPLLESLYTRAFRFPDNQYNQAEPRSPRRFSGWLASQGAKARELYPNVGAIVEGRARLFDQARLNLYSGPGASVHTDNLVARRGGLNGAVAQGLMATALETELYRDLFGLAFYKRGDVSVSYLAPISCGVSLRSACVVESVTDEEIHLRTAVATTLGDLVSVGTASVRHWSTEEDIN